MVANFATCLEDVHEWYFADRKQSGWYSWNSEDGFYELDVTHWLDNLPEPPNQPTT